MTVSVRPTVSIALSGTAVPTEGGITTFLLPRLRAATGAPIQNVKVDYGDGSSDNLGSVSGTFTVQHVYRDDGSFTPTVFTVEEHRVRL